MYTQPTHQIGSQPVETATVSAGQNEQYKGKRRKRCLKPRRGNSIYKRVGCSSRGNKREISYPYLYWSVDVLVGEARSQQVSRSLRLRKLAAGSMKWTQQGMC